MEKDDKNTKNSGKKYLNIEFYYSVIHNQIVEVFQNIKYKLDSQYFDFVSL